MKYEPILIEKRDGNGNNEYKMIQFPVDPETVKNAMINTFQYRYDLEITSNSEGSDTIKYIHKNIFVKFNIQITITKGWDKYTNVLFEISNVGITMGNINDKHYLLVEMIEEITNQLINMRIISKYNVYSMWNTNKE